MTDEDDKWTLVASLFDAASRKLVGHRCKFNTATLLNLPLTPLISTQTGCREQEPTPHG